MRRRIITAAAVILACSASLCGCSNGNADSPVQPAAESEPAASKPEDAPALEDGEDPEITPEDETYGIEIAVSPQGQRYTSDFPYYYTDMFFGGGRRWNSIQKRFLCAAASAASRYRAEYMLPGDARKAYGYDGTNEDAVLAALADDIGLVLEKGTFSVEKAADASGNFGFALVHVTNPSQYGKTGDWILIKAVLSDGTASVFDPARKNTDTCCVGFSTHGKELYSIPEMLTALGNGDVYYFTAEADE